MCVTQNLEIISIAIDGKRHVPARELSHAVAEVEAHEMRMQLSNPHLDCFAPQRAALNVARQLIAPGARS